MVEAVLAGLGGCFVAGGYGKSPGVTPVGRAFLEPVGLSSRRVTGVRVLGEGGADPAPSGGDRRRPAPGRVDAQPELSGAAGDAGRDVQDPVAERFDLAARQVGMVGEPDEFGPGDQIGCRGGPRLASLVTST